MARNKEVPDPSDSELAILHVLWRKGPSSVRAIWDEMGRKSGYTTVLKFLQIMLEKKLVRRDASRHSHVYEAAVEKERTQERLVSGLIDRAFSGSSSQLVLRALAAKPVSEEELKTILALLGEEGRKQP